MAKKSPGRQRPANFRAVFRVEAFKRTTKSVPIVRLFRGRDAALKEVSLSGRGVRPGELLLLRIDPNALVSCTEAELVVALHAVVKRLREVRSAATMPTPVALEVQRLRNTGLSVTQIARRFARRWRDCADVESRVRRVNRCLKAVRNHQALAKARELASLTSRQRTILEALDSAPPPKPATD